jgi:WD40 repeat protein
VEEPHRPQLAVHPEGRLLAYTSNRAVRLCDLTEGRILPALTVGWHSTVINAVCFSPDGKTIATADVHGHIKLWSHSMSESHPSAVTYSPWKSLRVGTGDINGICSSPDGRHLVTANGNGTVSVLRLSTP